MCVCECVITAQSSWVRCFARVVLCMFSGERTLRRCVTTSLVVAYSQLSHCVCVREYSTHIQNAHVCGLIAAHAHTLILSTYLRAHGYCTTKNAPLNGTMMMWVKYVRNAVNLGACKINRAD